MRKTTLSFGDRLLYIDKRSDLDLPFFQNILDENYKNSVNAYCRCSMVPMSIKRYSNKYILATYPYRLSEHKENCVFSDTIDYIKEDRFYRLSSLQVLTSSLPPPRPVRLKEDGKDTYDLSRWMRDSEIDKVLDNDEYRRCYNNFSSLISDIVDDVYVWSFNYLNKSADRADSGKMKTPSVPFIVLKVIKTIEEDILLPNRLDIKNYIANNDINIYIGTILDYKVRSEDVLCISTNSSFPVPHVLWASAIRKLIIKNKNNTLKPPYFYVSIVNKGKMTRFWLLPIANIKRFAPVESNIEREIFNDWTDKKAIFFKPISVNSYLTIFKMPYRDILPLVQSGARPDAVFFEDGRIKIIEIVDKAVLEKDKNYRIRLEEKEKYYRKLSHPFYYERLVV